MALLGARQSTEVLQERTALALLKLAMNDDNKVKVAAAGAIPPLVALLGVRLSAAAVGSMPIFSADADKQMGLAVVTSEVVQEKAAELLKHHAYNPRNRVEIAVAGALPPLVVLLRPQTSVAVRAEAAGTIWNLASIDDIKTKIVGAGAIPPLVALLGPSNTAELQELAAGALACIAANRNATARPDCRCRCHPAPSGSDNLIRPGTPAKVQIRAGTALQMLTLNDADSRALFTTAFTALHIPVALLMTEVLSSNQQPSQVSSWDMGIASDSSANTSLSTASSSVPRQQLHPDQQATAMIITAQTRPQQQQQQQQQQQPEVQQQQQRQQPARPPSRKTKSQQPCWSCGTTGVPLKKCSGCTVASYCGSVCQRADWGVHKSRCAGLKAASEATRGHQPAGP